MSKVLEASCVAGVVTIDGLPAASATILSEGVGPSEGIAVIDGEDVTYVAKTSPDLKTVIGKLVDTLTQLTTALTAIDAKPTGGVASATTPVAAAAVVALTLVQTELSTLKEALK